MPLLKTDKVFALGRAVGGLYSRLPGASIILRELEVIEDALLIELRDRLYKPTPLLEYHPPVSDTNSAGSLLPQRNASPLHQFQRKLAEALDQRPHDIWQRWAVMLVGQLTPDETRIIAALSDGGRFPMVSVRAAASLTGGSTVLRENFSTIWRAAKLQVQDLVPSYLSHLQVLGLVVRDAPESDEEIDYQILEVSTAVLVTVQEAQQAGYHRVRVERHSIRLSELGMKFWEICNTDEEDFI
ncbi:MAG: Abi-alpha family protein [Spongiibacteraceae bacterium]